MPSQNTLYLKLTGRTNCNSHEAHRQSHSQSKNLLMIHTGGNYIQVLARCYCEWKVSCYYKWVCVGEPMVAYIVVCIMILCSGAILEGNCFPFRLSDWGLFFFFFFSFSFTVSLLLSENHHMNHMASMPKKTGCKNTPPFSGLLRSQSNLSHHLAHSFSTAIFYTYWLCMRTTHFQTSKKKVQIWHTIDSPTCWGSF